MILKELTGIIMVFNEFKAKSNYNKFEVARLEIITSEDKIPLLYIFNLDPRYVDSQTAKIHKKWLLTILTQYMSLDDELAQETYDIFDNNIFEYVE